jgi:hypothetical protein
MKKVPVVITLATLCAFFFQFTPYIGFPDKIFFGMFLFSPFIVLNPRPIHLRKDFMMTTIT